MKTRKNIICSALALFALAYFAISPRMQATCQEGCLADYNTVLGDNALLSNVGSVHTAIGHSALLNNTTGDQNTAIGGLTLVLNTTGSYNTAIGSYALYDNTTGSYNTAIGEGALDGNTTGTQNTAIGGTALRTNTTGGNNTATGFDALYINTTGYSLTATGAYALFSNTTGIANTAAGGGALYTNTMGNNNTASGLNALYYNTTGNDNTAEGQGALQNNTIGSSNIALGSYAGLNLTTGSNNIDIGASGVAGESKTIRIGTGGTQTKTFIAGISGVTVPGGVGVIVGTNGKLGTVVSSARFKDEIKPMDKASEAILALKPVTFRYKKELDSEAIPQFGLVAEEVEKVNPDLVARDEQGKPYTVRYEAVNAMLLNEFLKEHRKVEQLTKDFKSKLADQQTQIQQLTAGLQKVSAQLELSKPAPQTVLNDQ